ncbi:Oidioi.mRNA.OKI2018_I69.chr1.g42.t1.cds [Oikopleura dioica]|uniref:Oidioi.mRNA.OKI2018_I69.chr1.g42.t1.cds n=1 Tax=Oikopleura dioica TaxID=34765 RepID=A0ABN7SMU2_OIKDI|nr:Oidioi.mRNA.OKI2018_I69.chr1.g42.t1.cds [Oikopleura dioica]
MHAPQVAAQQYQPQYAPAPQIAPQPIPQQAPVQPMYAPAPQVDAYGQPIPQQAPVQPMYAQNAQVAQPALKVETEKVALNPDEFPEIPEKAPKLKKKAILKMLILTPPMNFAGWLEQAMSEEAQAGGEEPEEFYADDMSCGLTVKSNGFPLYYYLNILDIDPECGDYLQIETVEENICGYSYLSNDVMGLNMILGWSTDQTEIDVYWHSDENPNEDQHAGFELWIWEEDPNARSISSSNSTLNESLITTKDPAQRPTRSQISKLKKEAEKRFKNIDRY